ncbi:hypothetical protein ANO14919_006180 [Xylariales sp. No.14919]|nr:hypothetical protein ANO14919_006180 [Xylariales sp. No.14919]
MARHISWMPFELPDPSLYPAPPSLQPKRPVATEVVSSAGDTVPQSTMTGKVGATLSTARTRETSISGKPVPSSVPTSAMRTGPTPLSQIQKRALTTRDATQKACRFRDRGAAVNGSDKK